MPGLHRRNESWVCQINELPKRPTIAIGKVTRQAARAFVAGVEGLLASARTGAPPDARTGAWLESLDAGVRVRLTRLGLLRGFGPVPSLSDWCGQFMTTPARGGKARKPGTLKKYRLTIRYLLQFFDGEIRVTDVSPHFATEFVSWLYQRDTDEQVTDATVHMHVRHCRSIFNAAKRAKVILDNPFGDLDGSAVESADRRYIGLPETHLLLRHAPNLQWLILIGLCRYAGLRCPTDCWALNWSDIDLPRRRFRVMSSKTDKLREPPIVPALYAILAEAAQGRDRSDDRVLTISTNNLHRTLDKIADRAGIDPDGLTFQAMRQSCENDWKAQGVAEATYTAWLGHSAAVSRRHYAVPIDSEYKQVTGGSDADENALHFCMQSSPDKARHSGTVSDSDSDENEGVEGENVQFSPEKKAYSVSGPCRIRTCDRSIMSRLL